MGAGNAVERGKFLPSDFQTFKALSQEVDKLKFAGLTNDELFILMEYRYRSGASLAKENDVRPVASTANSTEVKEIKRSALLIDDSATAAKVAKRILEKCNFNVLVGSSANEGFDLLREHREEIAIVFLDLVMPEVDGAECLEWIKDEPSVADIPIYMLSGLEDQVLTDLCIERGAVGMIMKPLTIAKVGTILRDLGMESFSSRDDTSSNPLSSSSEAKAEPVVLSELLSGNPTPKKITVVSTTASVPPATVLTEIKASPLSETAKDSKGSVLVVDDSSVSVRVVTKKLMTMGYSVVTAYNGLIAFDLIKKDHEKITAILADVCMPVCDGMEFLKLMKGEPHIRTPVVMMSGLEGSELEDSLLELGAAGLLRKPLDGSAFIELLAAFAAKRAAEVSCNR